MWKTIKGCLCTFVNIRMCGKLFTNLLETNHTHGFGNISLEKSLKKCSFKNKGAKHKVIHITYYLMARGWVDLNVYPSIQSSIKPIVKLCQIFLEVYDEVFSQYFIDIDPADQHAGSCTPSQLYRLPGKFSQWYICSLHVNGSYW